ncbi:hypothetical protein QQF64_017340 [Cirrhinus molitorella]|uniref:Uncharacterized protein n=1 Tax=Cirrhinus molitorella TaxID=172907 RepID=A0ABR3LID4_9TELE
MVTDGPVMEARTGGMSTCKTLEPEVVKKKADRGHPRQILSKLRMAKSPIGDRLTNGHKITACHAFFVQQHC